MTWNELPPLETSLGLMEDIFIGRRLKSCIVIGMELGEIQKVVVSFFLERFPRDGTIDKFLERKARIFLLGVVHVCFILVALQRAFSLNVSKYCGSKNLERSLSISFWYRRI